MTKPNFAISMTYSDYIELRKTLTHLEFEYKSFNPYPYRSYLTDEDRTFIKLRFPDIHTLPIYD